MAENQFDCFVDHLAELQIQMTSLTKGEHEKFVERNIRFTKERCRGSFASLPYKSIPCQMAPGKYHSLLDQLLSEVTRDVGHDGPKIDNEWNQTINGTHQIPIQTVLPNTRRV